MPCSDSSSSILLKLDNKERFISFDFAKITCGRRIEHGTGFDDYCKEKTLSTILNIHFVELVKELKILDEEGQYVLYLEWDCLRCAIAQYLGLDIPEIDTNRCQVSSISHTEEGVEIAQVILPPAAMPKILPCSLGEKKAN